MRRILFALAIHAVIGGLPATADAQVAALAERPVLVLDPGMHTAPIIRADVDRDGRFVVTGSHDKTVRVWSAEDGGCSAPSACRRAPAMSARSMRWRSAPTAR